MSTLKVSNIQDISNNAAMSISGGVVTATNAIRATGSVLQVKNVQTGEVNFTTDTIPNDDSRPLKTEGKEFMTLAITPKSASSKLLIEVVVGGSPNSAAAVTAALFQDDITHSLAAMGFYHPTGTGQTNITFKHFMTAGTTSTTTFKVRVGSHTGNFTFNGTNNTNRVYGGVYASSITITEIGG